MKVYRACWLCGAVSSCVVGLAVALVRLEAAALVLLPVFGLVGGLVSMVTIGDEKGTASWARVRRVGRWALVTAAVGGAFGGLLALWGAGAFLPAIVFVAGSPPALRACRRGVHSLPRPSAPHFDALARSLARVGPVDVPFESAFDLRLLTDEQLCEAWRASQPAVSSPSPRRALIRAVEERGRYLDEFERRQPSVLTAWLASATEGSGGPLPYLAAARPDTPVIDWDQLIDGQANDR